MRKISFTVAAATTFTAAALGLAGTAVAAPTGRGNAADAVKELQAEGYNLQINGSVTDPLSACATTGVHGVLPHYWELVHDRLCRRLVP